MTTTWTGHGNPSRHRSQRRIALFPGAFRPPHRAHFAAVSHLAARSDVDEVVVIVANRHRHLPGTTRMLGPETAARIWDIYRRDLPKVRVEIATGSAVGHALGWFERARSGDHLLFCVGESDLGRGDRRFRSIPERSGRRGVSAETVAAPTADLPGRATAVRRALAAGDAGRRAFRQSLPAHLDESDVEAVWRICRDGLRDVAEVAIERLWELARQWPLALPLAVAPTRTGKTDPVLRLEMRDGSVAFAKLAGDTVKDAGFDGPEGLKPRGRLSAERRAISRLSAAAGSVALPEVLLADGGSKLLVTAEVCPGGDFLDRRLETGRLDLGTLARCARMLAECHRDRDPAPLWGSIGKDRSQAEALLARCVTLARSRAPRSSHPHIEATATASSAAAGPLFANTDLRPGNIRRDGERLGLIDLERCTAWGDAARDLGFFIGEVAACCSRREEALKALEAIQAAYLDVADDRRAPDPRRVRSLAGMAAIAASARCEGVANAAAAEELGLELLAG